MEMVTLFIRQITYLNMNYMNIFEFIINHLHDWNDQ